MVTTHAFKNHVNMFFFLTGIMAKRAKKRNYSSTEMEVLVDEVESNQKIMFGSLSVAMTNKRNECC